MARRTNTAAWLPNQQRWQIKVQKNGVRRTFTSAKPGRTGQREANRKADAWLDEGITDTAKRCSDVWAEFLVSAQAAAGSSYADQIEKFGRNYILPVIGAQRIGDLNTGMLQDVLNRSYREGCLNPDSERKSKGNLSRKTLQGIRGVEVAFVKWARQHKYTALRPEDENLAVPKGARNKGKKILQPEALRVLLSTDTRVIRGKVVPDDNIHAYRVAVMTGLRPGELLGLRVGDVEGSRLHIGRAINRQNEETTGKNENAIRTVILHPLAAAEIRAQLQQRTMQSGPLRDDDPIFPLPNQQSLYNFWRFYQRSNGIPPISLYELRHTFVSMIEDAVSPAELRRMVGHSKSMDTFGWYSHAVTGRDKAAALVVYDVLAEYSPAPEKPTL